MAGSITKGEGENTGLSTAPRVSPSWRDGRWEYGKGPGLNRIARGAVVTFATGACHLDCGPPLLLHCFFSQPCTQYKLTHLLHSGLSAKTESLMVSPLLLSCLSSRAFQLTAASQFSAVLQTLLLIITKYFQNLHPKHPTVHLPCTDLFL